MKKNKYQLNLLFFIGIFIYALSFIATTKNQPDINPCGYTIAYWYNKDTVQSKIHPLSYFNDTVLIKIDTNYRYNSSTTIDSICKIFKTDCNNTTGSILGVNKLDTTKRNWDTPYGKKIFFYKCP